MDSKIISYISRYVIPFYYDYENDGYGRIKRFLSDNEVDYKEKKLADKGQWIEAGFWEDYNSSEDKAPESELFSFLPDIFQTDAKHSESARNLGLSFVYKASGRIMDNLECEVGESRIPFKISDLGILILKNGIGFVWYQIEIKNNKKDEGFDTNTYISFLNEFKELARSENGKISRTEYNQNTKQKDVSVFSMGNWIREILSAEELGIRFWSERSASINGEKEKRLIPDKALLFQYLFVEKDDEVSKEDIAFRSATGFDLKYCISEDLENDVYRPFGNTCFYISKSGMSYVVINDNTNTQFFKGEFGDRFKREYFFIYMLLLFQSYSCAHYSRLLTKLPANEKAFESGNEHIDKLESINGQINLFMVKSVFDSISNMGHQNEVYRYGKSRLYIDEDIQSLTIGLDALRDIVRDKRESKVNRALIIFGFIVVVSAWIDGVNLVDWFLGKLGCKNIPLNAGHGIISIIIIGLTIYLFIVLSKNRKG